MEKCLCFVTLPSGHSSSKLAIALTIDARRQVSYKIYVFTITSLPREKINPKPNQHYVRYWRRTNVDGKAFCYYLLTRECQNLRHCFQDLFRRKHLMRPKDVLQSIHCYSSNFLILAPTAPQHTPFSKNGTPPRFSTDSRRPLSVSSMEALPVSR